MVRARGRRAVRGQGVGDAACVWSHGATPDGFGASGLAGLVAPQPSLGGNRANRRSQLRAPVLALRRAQDPVSAAAAARDVRVALLAAEESDEPADGALLGMAAAQAGRLGLKELVESLCAYVWCRLQFCGGREVAELAAAAAKLDCYDSRFFSFVAKYCSESPHCFACLRDVAMVATAFLRWRRPQQHSNASGDCSKVDHVLVLHGLSISALPHFVGGTANVRDIAEFLYAFGHAVSATSPIVSGSGLTASSSHDHSSFAAARPTVAVQVSEAIVCGIAAVRPHLHRASGQDVAKLAGCVGAVWPVLPQLRDGALQPFAAELAQVVRFRHTEFNAQDIALTAVAFSKLSNLDSLAAEVLASEVVRRLPEFMDKDLSLLLWACSRPGWAADRCIHAAVDQVHKRSLSRFLVQDLCMVAQALAKIGPQAKASLTLVADEAFARQLSGFSTVDKAIMLWSVAKAKVAHPGLCRILVRSLAVENCRALARDVISATLWSLAVTWQSLPKSDGWPVQLLQGLCFAEPWGGAPPYEVANAVWAFGQLPHEYLARFWPSLLVPALALSPSSLSTHELCNLLNGVSRFVSHGGSVCNAEVSGLLAACAAELTERLQTGGGEELSVHDRRSLLAALSTSLSLPTVATPSGLVMPPLELAALAELLGVDGQQHQPQQQQQNGGAAVGGRREDGGRRARRGKRAQPAAPKNAWCEPPEPTEHATEPATADGADAAAPSEAPAAATTQPTESHDGRGGHVSPAGHGGVESAASTTASTSDAATGGEGHGAATSAGKSGSQGRDRSPKPPTPPPPAEEDLGAATRGRGRHRGQGLQLVSRQERVRRMFETSKEGGGDLETPDVSPSRHLEVAGVDVPDVPDGPHIIGRRHGRHICGMTCCPKVYHGDHSLHASIMRLNAHCSYGGHCVRLKHTFIHLECTNVESDDACQLCKLAKRRRAKSSDHIDSIRNLRQSDERLSSTFLHGMPDTQQNRRMDRPAVGSPDRISRSSRAAPQATDSQ
mmetsp:Transcript_22372/g.64166  ORF Transcript_22372/g.64166 Transcript_22372/m.64166 type:complete len:1008 (+) Transcript_22372:90-3113(+)